MGCWTVMTADVVPDVVCRVWQTYNQSHVVSCWRRGPIRVARLATSAES